MDAELSRFGEGLLERVWCMGFVKVITRSPFCSLVLCYHCQFFTPFYLCLFIVDTVSTIQFWVIISTQISSPQVIFTYLNFAPQPFVFLRFYLFLERGEKEREKYVKCESYIDVASHAPALGPGPQPRHVTWLGIKSLTFWLAIWGSVHWATPASASILSITGFVLFYFFTSL